MLAKLLNRLRPADEDRLRSALLHASERNFARRLRALRRGGRLEELPCLVSELSALAALKRNLETLSAEDSVSRLRSQQESAGRNEHTQPERPKFALGTDLLFGLHHRLFPAERMAVIGGRTERGQVVLSSFFDVTSEERSSGAHTRADAARLAAALMAMDTARARLVAWAHSHPGRGAPASFPSPTDRRQYDAWTDDFGPLVALIFTEDGHIRFWGETKDSVGIVGTGVERSAYDFYRLKL